MRAGLIFAAVVASCFAAQGGRVPLAPPGAKYEVKGPDRKDGVETYVITSAYQQKPVNLYVLLPEKLDRSKTYKVLFVLPAWNPSPDGIKEAKKLDLHNKHNLICVGPDFSTMPWYGDHSDNPKIRYDSYLPEVIVPFIDRTYPTIAKPEGRLLVGFSKSGMGAVSLLLRHPDVFGRAGSWDGCLMVNDRAEFYGTKEHFMANYYIPNLLTKHANRFKDKPARLAITGFGIASFEKGTEDAHKLMDKLGIPHYYENRVQRKHEWGSGWLVPLVEVLMADDMVKATPDRPK